MEKKGQGIQFNWIFVIVAGVIILSFFVMFTFNYIQLQNTKQSVYASRSFVNVLTYMESSYTGKGLVIDSTSDNAFKLNYFTNLNVNCEGERSSIIINGEPLSEQVLQDEIVFAPKVMVVNAVDTWIQPWYYPYFTSNFIFLARPEKKIYIKYDPITKDFVYNMQINSWTEFNTKLVQSVSDIQAGKDVSVLWVSMTPPDTNQLKKVKTNSSYYNLIHVVPNLMNKVYTDGKIVFYENDTKFEDKFYGEATIYAALFSGGHGEYKCEMTRAINKLKKVSESMTGKIDLLSRLNHDEGCKLIYSNLRNMLKSYSSDKGIGNAELIMNENTKLIGNGCVSVF
jgi:hypothetical protein